jgi:hypothetical protein
VPRPSITPIAVLACVVATLAGSVEATAASSATPRFVTRANAVCASARAQVARLAPLYPMARTARIGDRWLKIDRAALVKLRALKLPAAKRAESGRFVKAAGTMVNSGVAGLVKAAKARKPLTYAAADKRLTALIWSAHLAATRAGLPSCFRW